MSSTAHAPADAHAHVDNKFELFVQLAMLLAVITGVEIVMVYLPFVKWLIVGGLVVLSVVKFMSDMMAVMQPIEKAGKIGTDKTTEVTAGAKDGKDLASLARTAGLDVKTSEPIIRGGSIPDFGAIADRDKEIFSLPIGKTGTPSTVASKTLVFAVKERKDLDPEIDLDIVAKAPRRGAIDVAVSDSFGFGGQNAVLVFTSA